MRTDPLSSNQRRGKSGGKSFPAAICNFLGTLILLLVIATAVPLTIPRLMGYEIYSVVSGSMEPEIPVGSVIYVAPRPPEEVQEGEVIAFRSGGSVVTHRVIRNQFVEGVFITKGDANPTEDINSVPYAELIGTVERHYPMIGRFLMIYASRAGKLYALCLAACGVMFNVLAQRLRDRQREKRERSIRELEADVARHLSPDTELPEKHDGPRRRAPKKRRGRLRGVLMLLLLAAFLISGGVIFAVKRQYRLTDEFYRDSSSRFTTAVTPRPLDGLGPLIPGNEAPEEEQHRPEAPEEGECAPFKVDFEALCAVNSDVVGWIYCEGTPIDYPILHGENNEVYIHHTYDRQYRAAGSIFEECVNRPGFQDQNSILYGHHMNSGSMFACLEQFTDQSFFDEHPVMWILTPERDYRVELFSAYTISAYSDAYTVYTTPGPAFDDYLLLTKQRSLVRSDVELDGNARYVMLSTCAYVFDNARSVVHGKLVPVNSAGGLPLSGEERE